MKIAVLPYGWVFVGKHSEENGKHVLKDAKNIRSWRGGKGLGHIAKNGPDDKVTLDEAGVIEFKDYVCMYECDESKWK